MEQEFTALINTHRGILFKVCNLYLDNNEDKKDLFQEIVLQLWKSYPRFRQESSFSTWMYRVALNMAVSHFRKQNRIPLLQQIPLEAFNIPDFDTDRGKNENLRYLQAAIGQLSKIEKAIMMCYLDEMSYQEISEIMGISVGNVGVKLNRIKNKLQKIINSIDYELQ